MAREQQQLGPAAATPGLLPGEAAAPRPNYSQDKLLLLRCQLVLLPLPGTSSEPPAPCAACSALPGTSKVRAVLQYLVLIAG
jgi:hypothetical protein